ncbi:hypothetical protein GCM10027168_16800 [Streptomyces capparidis]
MEILHLRGETGEVFATPEGDLEAIEHLRPIRTRVGGAWKPVDTTLVRHEDGTVTPRAATVGLEFSGGGGEPLVRLERAGRSLALSWPGSLPAPRLEGDTATYPEVVPDVDLRVRAQADGFQHLLVVKSAQAAASEELSELRLGLGTEAVTVRETAAGGVEALDGGSGGVVFEAPTPMMWDSGPGDGTVRARRTATTAGEEPRPGETGKLAPLKVEVPPGGGELLLTPDRDVLTGPDTVYPVYIDPQWYTPKTTAWTMASKYWENSPQWKFNGERDAGLGYCNWAYCKPHDTKRLFYRIPTAKFAGKTILNAEFVVRETHAASCEPRKVQLWRTKDISSSTTWNSQLAAGFWIDHLTTGNFAHGHDGCEADDAEFDILGTVQQAAAKSWPSITFGLRAEDENDPYGWKRFSDDAFLRVRYNRPPTQVKTSQLTMDPGGTCKKPSTPARIRSLPRLRANNVGDPDGDRVAVQFRASWNGTDGKRVHWTWPTTGDIGAHFKASGSDHDLTLPSSTPRNKAADWYVRVWDGGNWSPWSFKNAYSCTFLIDTSVPAGPAIASDQYPASDPNDPQDPWLDGVGRYGTFTLTSPTSDVVAYRYGVNGDPKPGNSVSTTSGAARTIRVLPEKAGINFVTAQALDSAGNASEVRTHVFRVRSGQPARAVWQFDESAGAVRAEGTSPPRRATLHGGAATGAEGAVGTALSLDGVDDHASTDIAAIDTAMSFSVSAWARLSKAPGGSAVVVAQSGDAVPGFELHYSKEHDRWAFTRHSSDRAGATPVRAMQAGPGGAKAGEWAHLVGTYDSAASQMRLYVNGALAGRTAFIAPWDARRGLHIGASAGGANPGSFFPGLIDEVQVFDRPVTEAEVRQLHAKQRIEGPGRPARAVFPLDTEDDPGHVTGHSGVLPAVLHGGAESGATGVDARALHLDGTDDRAVVAAPHIDTSRSFAVSVWARLPRTKPGHTAVILTQTGTHKSGIELYYSTAYDRWILNQHSADTPEAGSVRAIQTKGAVPQGGEWAHLAGVHDTVANTLTLYVNGVEAGTATLGNAWTATGPLQIGAGSYNGAPGNFFPGDLDDLRLFDRPLAEGEVRQLFRQRPLVKGRWAFETETGRVTPDASAAGRGMTLSGDAAVGAEQPRVDRGALLLKSGTGQGSVAPAPVDSGASFTVTAWARAAAEPTRPATVISQEGTHQNGYTLRYSPDAGGSWQLAMPGEDAAEAETATVGNQLFASATAWNHLAVVYDGFSDELSLYVNGELQSPHCTDGESGDTSCVGSTSWASDVLAFNATKALNVGCAKSAGRCGEHWSGEIDDLWAFQGALNEAQIQYLAEGWNDISTTVPDGG